MDMSGHRLVVTSFAIVGLFLPCLARAQAYPGAQPAPTAPPSAYPPASPGYPPATAPTYPPAAPTYPPAAPAPQEPPPGWVPAGGYPPAAQYPRYPTTPLELRYVEGRPIPPGYHLESRARKGLVISGAIVFGVPYFLSLSVAASSRLEADRWLYAPIIGPFVDLGQRKEDCDTSQTGPFRTDTFCSGDSSERFFLMSDGLMQVAGATMLIFGLAMQQKLLVRDDAPFVGATRSHFAWGIAPQTMGRSGYGVGLGGIF